VCPVQNAAFFDLAEILREKIFSTTLIGHTCPEIESQQHQESFFSMAYLYLLREKAPPKEAPLQAPLRSLRKMLGEIA